MANLLPDVVAKAPHISALDALAENQINNLDLSGCLLYLIDTAPPEALPYLANSFDVQGYKGMKFAVTDTDQRNLLKNSIKLHQKKGTPWSIKNALMTSLPAILSVTLTEGISVQYNALYTYNGTVTFGGGWWAIFRAIITLDPTVSITAQLTSDIVNLILEYKPARCKLLDVTYLFAEIENVTPLEGDGIGPGQIVETLSNKYNGSFQYNAGEDYNQDLDEITVIVT